MTGEKRDRGDRGKLRKTLSEINPIGERLKFVRTTLKLSTTTVCEDTNIPISCYSNRETGSRTTFYEEILVLAIYFNGLWQARYSEIKSFPMFQGREVESITPMWLFYGEDKTLEEAKEIMVNIQDDFYRREIEHLERQLDLESQLNLFKSREDQNKRETELKQLIEKSKKATPIFGDGIGLRNVKEIT